MIKGAWNYLSGKKPAAEEKIIKPKKLSNDPETRAVMVIMLAMFDKVEETLKGQIVIPYTLKVILQAVNNDSLLKNPATSLISWACKRFVGVENLDFVKFIKDKITELVGKLEKQNDLMQTIQSLENLSKENPDHKSNIDAAKVLAELKLASGQNPEDLNQMKAKAHFRITNPCQCIPVPLTIVEALLNDVEFDLPSNIIEKVKANFLKPETLKLLQLDTLHDGQKHIKTILDDVLGVDARDIILEFFSQHIKDIILDVAHLLEKSAKDELNGISDFTDLLDMKLNMKNVTGKMKLRFAKWLGLTKAVRGNITGMIEEKIEEYSIKMEKWIATAKGDDWLKLIKGTKTFFKRMEESEKLDNKLPRQDGFEPLSCGECNGSGQSGEKRRPVNQKDPKGLEILVWQNHESKDNWVQATLVTPPKRPSDLVTVRYEDDEEKYFEEKVNSDRTVVVKKCLKCNGKGYSESDMYANAVYKGLSALTEAQEPISAVKFASDETVSEEPIDEVHAHPFANMGLSTSYGLGIGSPTIIEFNNKDNGITISDPESKTSQPGPPPSPRRVRVSEEKITTGTPRVFETPLGKRPRRRATITRRGRRAGPAPSKKKEIESTKRSTTRIVTRPCQEEWEDNESSRRRLGRAGQRTSSSEHRRLAAARADPKQRLHLTYEEIIGQGSQRIPVGLQWISDEIDAAEKRNEARRRI